MILVNKHLETEGLVKQNKALFQGEFDLGIIYRRQLILIIYKSCYRKTVASNDC